jgi:hypothetical protein
MGWPLWDKSDDNQKKALAAFTAIDRNPAVRRGIDPRTM